MNSGQEKWVIQPLGYKVRLPRRPFDEDSLAEIDYAGFNLLMEKLEEFDLIDESENDLSTFTLEALDSDWRSKLLDFFFAFWGDYEFTCTIDGLSDEVLVPINDIIHEKDIVNSTEKRKEIDKWCRANGKGKVARRAMVEYQESEKWIVNHLITKEKSDKRGKNPNSLKNLKQFRVDVEKVEA